MMHSTLYCMQRINYSREAIWRQHYQSLFQFQLQYNHLGFLRQEFFNLSLSVMFGGLLFQSPIFSDLIVIIIQPKGKNTNKNPSSFDY